MNLNPGPLSRTSNAVFKNPGSFFSGAKPELPLSNASGNKICTLFYKSSWKCHIPISAKILKLCEKNAKK
jgi:hypothetical protein